MTQVSDGFLLHHSHPHIRLFIELSRSPDAVHLPQMGIWVQYEAELRAALERVRLLEIDPATNRPYRPQKALDEVQKNISLAWQRHLESIHRHSATTEPSI
jgi:multiple sugar transport system substrate-binding protein